MFFFCLPFASYCERCVLSVEQQNEHDVFIEKLIEKPFILEHLTYLSDSILSNDEFHYLVGFKPGDVTSADKVKQAVNRFFKKKKFSQISLECDEQKSLHFSFVSFWTFAQLKMHSIVIQKDKYSRCFLLDPGDTFDEKKYNLSLENIRESFRQDGYFEGIVTSSLVRDQRSKSVIIHVNLQRGQRFLIGTISLPSDSSLPLWVSPWLTKQLKGRSYSKELLNREVEQLKRQLAKDGFLHVEIGLKELIDRENKKVNLAFDFNFIEKRKFIFFGNSFFSDKQLLDVVLQFGHSAWLIPPSILAQEIEREYFEKGFWSITAEAKEEAQRTFFVINEGSRAIIKDVEIIGANSFPSFWMIKRCFRPFLRNAYFDDGELKNSIEKLLSFYHKQGFWDAHILKQDFVPLSKKNEYKLELFIDEGIRSFLTSVSILSPSNLIDNSFFNKFLKTKLQIPFDPSFIQEQRQQLKKMINQLGYAQADAIPTIDRNGENVSLLWDLQFEKQVATFGKTIVQGNCDLPFHSMLRELCYKEGDPWDKEKISASLDRLKNLGIFEAIHFSPDVDVDGERDVLLQVRQDAPIELRVRAGAGLQQVSRQFIFGRGATYKLGGTILLKNPLNVADLFSIDADIARSYRNVSVEYIRPCIANMPLRIRYKAYANKYHQPGFVGCKKDLYEIEQMGFLLGIRNKCRRFDLGMNIGIEWMQTSIKNDMYNFAQQVSQAIRFSSSLLDHRVPYFFAEPILFIDHLDNKLNPHFGTFSMVMFKIMLPLSHGLPEAYFAKCMGEHSLFHSIGPVVFALHLRFGHIFYQQFENIMPFERFYLGGANSIRSYETDMCPPLGCFTDQSGIFYMVPQGGKTMINLNLEVRVPLFKQVGVVLFQDIGTLIGQSSNNFDVSELLAGTGFGLRYHTPIGPLRFDIGWKWRLNHASCHRYAWSLALGHAF